MQEDVADAAVLHHLAFVQHQHFVGDFGYHAKVVGDEQHTHAMLLLQFPDQFQNAFLHGHVQRSGGLVGNQQVGLATHSHGNHYALFLAARKFVRVRVENLLGSWQHHLLEQLDNMRFGFLLGLLLMQKYLFCNLLAALDDGIQRSHRFLENHADAVAAQVLHGCLGAGEQIDGLVIL